MERCKGEEFKETKRPGASQEPDGFAVHWERACGLLLINADWWGVQFLKPCGRGGVTGCFLEHYFLKCGQIGAQGG